MIHPDLQMQLECVEGRVTIWVVESGKILLKYLEELQAQFYGSEGRFVLSDSEHRLDINKHVELVLSPLEVDINDKKFLSKVYAELKELAFGENYYLETQQLFSTIEAYIAKLECDASVDLVCDEPDFSQIIKAAGVRIDDAADSCAERLGQYLHILSKVMKKRVVIFFNLFAYLEEPEIEELLREAFYLKLHVILIERQEYDIAIDKKYYIIDKDNCEIF